MSMPPTFARVSWLRDRPPPDGRAARSHSRTAQVLIRLSVRPHDRLRFRNRDPRGHKPCRRSAAPRSFRTAQPSWRAPTLLCWRGHLREGRAWRQHVRRPSGCGSAQDGERLIDTVAAPGLFGELFSDRAESSCPDRCGGYRCRAGGDRGAAILGAGARNAGICASGDERHGSASPQRGHDHLAGSVPHETRSRRSRALALTSPHDAESAARVPAGCGADGNHSSERVRDFRGGDGSGHARRRGRMASADWGHARARSRPRCVVAASSAARSIAVVAAPVS